MPTKRKPGSGGIDAGASRPSVKKKARTAQPGKRRTPKARRGGAAEGGGRKGPKARTDAGSRRVRQLEQLRSKQRPSLLREEEERFQNITLDVEGKRVVLTRRHFLYGALGAGAAAIMAAGAVLADDDSGQGRDGIAVDQDDVIQIDDLKEAERDSCLSLLAEHILPSQTLVWAGSDGIACCLTTTDQASPLTRVFILETSTGIQSTVLEAAQGQAEGFEVFDARACANGLIWVEANAMEGRWRVLAAPLSQELTLGDARVLDEGGPESETPSIAAAGDRAWWQVRPRVPTEKDADEGSTVLKRTGFSSGNAEEVWASKGRAACPIAACEGGVAVAVRSNERDHAFDLLMFGSKGTVASDSLELPSGMEPCAIGWGPNGFSFCFEGIYDYGGGISDLGTYTPAKPHQAGQGYDGLAWFHFGRTPQCGPCWCEDDWFMVKSTVSVCAVNLEKGIYCSLGTESGCAEWGDYLCSSGNGPTVVTAMQIDRGSSDGDSAGWTLVRVWQPGSDEVPENQ